MKIQCELTDSNIVSCYIRLQAIYCLGHCTYVGSDSNAHNALCPKYGDRLDIQRSFFSCQLYLQAAIPILCEK